MRNSLKTTEETTVRRINLQDLKTRLTNNVLPWESDEKPGVRFNSVNFLASAGAVVSTVVFMLLQRTYPNMLGLLSIALYVLIAAVVLAFVVVYKTRADNKSTATIALCCLTGAFLFLLYFLHLAIAVNWFITILAAVTAMLVLACVLFASLTTWWRHNGEEKNIDEIHAERAADGS